jgi:hypothetical protein
MCVGWRCPSLRVSSREWSCSVCQCACSVRIYPPPTTHHPPALSKTSGRRLYPYAACTPLALARTLRADAACTIPCAAYTFPSASHPLLTLHDLVHCVHYPVHIPPASFTALPCPPLALGRPLLAYCPIATCPGLYALAYPPLALARRKKALELPLDSRHSQEWLLDRRGGSALFAALGWLLPPLTAEVA